MDGFRQMSLFDYMDILKPQPVDIKGLLDDGYCPICGGGLDDLVKACPYCGTLLDWERWKKLNAN